MFYYFMWFAYYTFETMCIFCIEIVLFLLPDDDRLHPQT